jgi:hypothetical protein
LSSMNDESRVRAIEHVSLGIERSTRRRSSRASARRLALIP